MKRAALLLLAALALGLLGRQLVAHVRLVHPSSRAPLRWSDPSRVGIVLHARGSDDLPPGGHESALRLAIQEWNGVEGSLATLVEDASPASQAREDWESPGLHQVRFDEDNSSGFFPSGSRTVALTPIWFDGGRLTDADVLFNGAGFSFSSSGHPARFDVFDVAVHELGHLLGLDHTGAVGGSMYPYVDQGLILQRSLSADERSGLRDAYPSTAQAQLTGRVLRAEGGEPVSGAYLVARDAEGRLRASILSGTNGAFTLRGLAAGRYTVYARPLDTPVAESNLSPGYGGRIESDFAPAFYAGTAELEAGASVALGDLEVGPDVALTLGTAYDTYPIQATVGRSQTIFLHGSGLFVGATLEASDPDLVLGAPLWQGSQVSVQVSVPLGEPRGHVDLMVTDSAGRRAILPAALEITPPAPEVHALEPELGSLAGGETLTIHGSGFEPGLRVVIGGRIYNQGLDVTLLDGQTLQLVSAATQPGTHDVVVIDASGLEGRLAAAFQVLSAPAIASVLPSAGGVAGGSEVWLAGSGFEPGLRVRIGGVEQGPVTVVAGELVRFVTSGGASGSPLRLELENPDGVVAEQTFRYVEQLDPELVQVSPATGSARGGGLLTLAGAGFTPTTRVTFLADPAAAGQPAASVVFVDEHTLRVVTPAHAAGVVGLLVADASGCGVFAAQAFTFSGGGGGGGGGCGRLAPSAGPGGTRDALTGAWWMLALLGWLALRARRAAHA